MTTTRTQRPGKTGAPKWAQNLWHRVRHQYPLGSLCILLSLAFASPLAGAGVHAGLHGYWTALAAWSAYAAAVLTLGAALSWNMDTRRPEGKRHPAKRSNW